MAVEASRVSTKINAPPSKVWTALTDKQNLKKLWFGADVETNWRIGTPILWRGDWKGQKFEDKGVIKAFAPEKKLSFTHWSPLSKVPDTPEHYHTVTFDIKPAGKATEVVLTQENHDDSELRKPEAREELKKNWTMLLDSLKKSVEA